MKVRDAVQRDIDTLKGRAPELAESGLAASALALARAMDNPKNSATSKSMCARSLLQTLDRLFELAPDEDAKDGVDDISARYAARRAGASTPED